jgi:HAD superfamily hydrolase (TIGR01509 family)
MPANWEAIAFDMDGVLWQSTPCHEAAFDEVLGRLGVTGFDYKQYAGLRTAEVIRAEAVRMGFDWSDELVAQLAKQKTEHARLLINETRPVSAGCAELLEELHGRYALGLASSGSRGTVELFLVLSKTRDRFQSVLTGDDVRNAKPDPEIYERSAIALGVSAGRMLVVEDAVSGVKAGLAAGAAEVVGIGSGEHSALLIDAGACAVVKDLIGLGRWIRLQS